MKIKSVIYFFLLTLFIWVSLVFGQKSDKPKEIKIATPEWADQTNADGTGLFFEIVKRVYEPLGIPVKYHFVPWKRAQTLVNQQQCDAMLCVWKEHADEEGQVLPKYPLFIEHTVVIFKKGTIPLWKGIESLNGMSAVWLRGYDYHLFKHFENINFRQFHEVDQYDMAWHQLDMGRYDVYIDTSIDMDIYIKAHHVDMTQYARVVLWGEKAFVAFSRSKKSERLIQLYDQRIQILFKTGILEEIYRRWGVKFYPEYWEDGSILSKSKGRTSK